MGRRPVSSNLPLRTGKGSNFKGDRMERRDPMARSVEIEAATAWSRDHLTGSVPEVDIYDADFLLSYLFLEGDAPNEPLGSCGVDPTPDQLTCESFAVCR